MTTRDLQARPSLEVASARYDDMLSEMRAGISAARADTAWFVRAEGSTGPVGDVDGNTVVYAISTRWAFEGTAAQPAHVRAAVLATLADVGRRYGFSEPVIYVDREHEIQVVASDELGAEYTLGSAVNTTLSYVTGPHLLEHEESTTGGES